MPDEKTSARLRWIGAVLSLVSLGALLAHAFGILPMVYFLTFFGVPSVLMVFWFAAYANRIKAHVFINCLWVGLLGGLAGTLLYDGSRYVMQHSGMFDFNGFRAILIFGSWITGKETHETPAIVAGWLYHFWNGLSFGVFYALAFGKRHWVIGVVYGLIIEACMLGLFPLFLTVTKQYDFIMLSMLGHVFYGAALGIVVQKYGSSWRKVK